MPTDLSVKMPTDLSVKQVAAAGAALAVAMTAVPLAPAATAATPTKAPTTKAAQAPAGSRLLERYRATGVTYARYSTAQKPADITAYYSARFTAAGYAVKAGPASRTEATFTAKQGAKYAAVQAGAPAGSRTSFEICTGTSRSKVTTCDSRTSAS
jgi:hypothetical protein